MKVRSVENRAEWTGNLGPFKTPGGGKNIIGSRYVDPERGELFRVT